MYLSYIKIFMLLVVILQINLSADIVDSLKTKLDNAKGKERINLIIRLMERLERNKSEEAIRFGNEALRLLDINPDKKLEAEVFYHKGWAYYYLNNLDSAKYFSDLSGKIAKGAGYLRGQVMESLLRARIYRTEGLYEDAIKYLSDAREKNKEAEDLKLEIKILNEFGSVYRRLSRYNEAIDMHKKALELFQNVDDEEELTATYTYLGINSDLKGNYDEALGYHHKALELNKLDNDIRGIAGSTHNLGILYQKIKRYDESLEFYNSALKYWEELGNKNGLASTLNSIGAVNELTENYKEALYYYERALKIWEEMESKYSVSIALNNIGSIHEYFGNYNEAINNLQRAIDIREDIGDKNGTAGSMIVLAVVYNKTGKGTLAIETAKKALELAKETGNPTTLREAYVVLSDIYEKNGYDKEALSEYKNYKEIDDSLFNAETRENFAEMQEKYKSEEQKQQIELLQKENEIQNLYRTILIAGIILLLIIFILLYNRNRLKQRAANLRTEAAENKAAILQVQFEQKKKELDAARELQLSMLPSKIPDHPEVEISALMLTATEVGGDYYDFHQDENGTLTIALGDATGHGAQAGVMVTAVKSLFNLLVDQKDITKILNQSTGAIKKMNFPNIFMTMGLLRLKDGELELAGAGIPPAYIYRAGSGNVEEVPLKGLPLGSVYEFEYSKVGVTLYSGDVVAVTTDGFPELFNSKDEMMGFGKVPEILKEVGRKSPEEIIKHFTDTAEQWLNGTKQQDDMTFVVLKVRE